LSFRARICSPCVNANCAASRTSFDLVLQSPLASLNPALEIGTQLREAWRAHSERAATSERLRSGDQSSLKNVSCPCGGNDRDFLRKRASQLSVGRRNAY